MAAYASGSDDNMSRGGSPVPRGLFSDDSDDDGGRGRHSEAEEDNSLNRREGGAAGAAATQGNSDDEEEEERKRKEQQKKNEKKKPKGPVRRQMISEDMLIGKNGISTIPDLFKDFTFGGKGRERHDMDKILSKLEHWIHLLHPKQPFDQSLQRIEFLGAKRKIIKTHLKKIRMGMLQNFEENDLVVEEDDDMMMENMDATELAEGASAAVNERASSVDNINDEDLVPSSSVPVVTPANTGSNDNEFPDDDDEFFETIDETTIGATKPLNEMDIDMDDVPSIHDDDEEDDFIQKQIEAQLKRAETANTQQQPSQGQLSKDANDDNDAADKQEASTKQLEPETHPAPSSSSPQPITPNEEAEAVAMSSEIAPEPMETLDETVAVVTSGNQNEQVVDGKTDKGDSDTVGDNGNKEKEAVLNDDDGTNLDDLEDNED